MNAEDLKKWHAEELDVLKKFARICDELELPYFLAGGTLLGAVRHQGFIPWDDDADVFMPRPSYNKLLEAMKTYELGDAYRFLTYENTEDYRYPWARMISLNMKIINRSANIPRIEHVWVDIIPLDGLPDHRGERYLHKRSLKVYRDLNNLIQYDELVDQTSRRGRFGKAKLKASGLVHGAFHSADYRNALRRMTEELEDYPFDWGKEVINFAETNDFKEIFPRKCFEETAYYPFEDTYLAGPKDYDTVLRILYGDAYMDLPPAEKRYENDCELVVETWRK
ncbi:MAG: LicD family protein [Erysipelotrichales bacterium]|nr:LicD family protein [Erysipelotrichales bacterium]